MAEWVGYYLRFANVRSLQDLVETGGEAAGIDRYSAVEAAHEALLEYARTREGRGHDSWQAAWNALTHATEEDGGFLDLQAPCPGCEGRFWKRAYCSQCFGVDIRRVCRVRTAFAREENTPFDSIS